LRKKDKQWYINGKRHRLDGPAIDIVHTYGYRSWWIDGKKHREDGPAVESPNGVNQYWISGVQIHCEDNEEFLRIVKMKSFI
jgi:hypothetical protein